MTEYDRLYRKAEKKGWRVPLNKDFCPEGWIHYWKAMEYRGQQIHIGIPESALGRPIAPHRVGR